VTRNEVASVSSCSSTYNLCVEDGVNKKASDPSIVQITEKRSTLKCSEDAELKMLCFRTRSQLGSLGFSTALLIMICLKLPYVGMRVKLAAAVYLTA
jgi:hypothetical protein